MVPGQLAYQQVVNACREAQSRPRNFAEKQLATPTLKLCFRTFALGLPEAGAFTIADELREEMRICTGHVEIAPQEATGSRVEDWERSCSLGFWDYHGVRASLRHGLSISPGLEKSYLHQCEQAPAGPASFNPEAAELLSLLVLEVGDWQRALQVPSP